MIQTLLKKIHLAMGPSSSCAENREEAESRAELEPKGKRKKFPDIGKGTRGKKNTSDDQVPGEPCQDLQDAVYLACALNVKKCHNYGPHARGMWWGQRKSI